MKNRGERLHSTKEKKRARVCVSNVREMKKKWLHQNVSECSFICSFSVSILSSGELEDGGILTDVGVCKSFLNSLDIVITVALFLHG